MSYNHNKNLYITKLTLYSMLYNHYAYLYIRPIKYSHGKKPVKSVPS